MYGLSLRSFAAPRTMMIGLAICICASARPARAVTPDSPEVQQLLDRAFSFLDAAKPEGRLGAKCLVGLCYLKHGETEAHAAVKDAADACVHDAKNPDGIEIYDNGLAIIFLCELNSSKYQAEINSFLKSLRAKQRRQGGWGYISNPQFKTTGDTSMTQYGVLASWEARRHGFVVPIESIEGVCMWLMRTQDPTGGWGYQGVDPGQFATGEFRRVKQSDVHEGLSAAGLGSTYICADLLGLNVFPKQDEEDANLPPALKQVRTDVDQDKVLTQKITADQLRNTQELGRRWWSGNYKIESKRFQDYYLYALERMQSFYELAAGLHIAEPGWYNDGVRLLKLTQQADGSWDSGNKIIVPDTCFGILFLLRSTKKSIEKTKGYESGLAAGGQGLPRDLSEVHVREGQIVAKPITGSLAALIDVLGHPESHDFRALADDPQDIIRQLGEADAPTRETHLSLLRRMALHGPAESRLAAVRVLAGVRDIGSAPTLIAALSDGQWKVVYIADQGLRFLSRRVGVTTISELPDEPDRRNAIKSWKTWYASVRPTTAATP